MHTMTAIHNVPRTTRKAINPVGWLVNAVATHRQRLRLQDLDAHLLEDIGIDRAIACREAQRPFWDLPR